MIITGLWKNLKCLKFAALKYLIVLAINTRDIHVMSRRTNIFILLLCKNVYAHQVHLFEEKKYI